MSAVAAEPLAIWDVNGSPDYFHKSPHWLEASEWAADHGLEPFHAYRIEFYLIDTPFAKVFRYAVNAEGRRYRDLAADDAARAEPVIIVLSELPPVHLREGLG